jgi:competence protein CoiA
MRLAFVDGIKSEATPGAIGTCINPRCASPMIAKCGRVKVWHWSHKGKKPCDPWYESETQWHRDWKDRFPLDWQEIIQQDQRTGEVHIADVKTSHGLVLEFQHSVIDPAEMRAREAFYENMVWIVDGLRSAMDISYFNMGLSGPIQDDPLAYQVTWWGRGQLLRNWGEAKAKVYLDFGGTVIWRLVFFDAVKKVGAVGPVDREAFVEDCLSGSQVRLLANGPKLPAPLVRVR